MNGFPRQAYLFWFMATASGCSYELKIQPGSCYDIAIAPWPASADYGADTIEIAPPPRVRLDRTTASSNGNALTIAELPGVMPSIHSIARWRMLSPDSIEMVWSTGFGGVALRLGGEADSLVGVAESFFDYREGHETRAAATRIDCGAPIPAASRAARRFSVGVPLASDDTLRIGAELPQNVRLDSVVSVRGKLRGRPVGSFRDADSMHVDINESRVITYMLIFYPDTMHVEPLAARLEALLGPPTQATSTPSIDGRPHEIVGWVDRYDVIFVWGPANVRISLGSQRGPR